MGKITSSQLNKIRKKLLQERKELSERESSIGKDMRRKLSADSGEQALDLENSEVLEELLREAREQLDATALALTRFDAGVYQYCMDCKDEISLERLQAYPATTRCIECAERAQS